MDKNSLETNLKELESIVSKMEQGDMALEDSIKSYEKGMLLLKLCQDSLKEIEQKVLVLSAENTLEQFKSSNE